MSWIHALSTLAVLAILGPAAAGERVTASGTLHLTIKELGGKGALVAVPARVHLADAHGKAVLRAGGADVQGPLQLRWRCRARSCRRGPTPTRSSVVRNTGGLPDAWRSRRDVVREHQVVLRRTIDLAARGWYSGETHVHRPPDDMPLLMRSEDLHVAPLLTVWNNANLLERPAPAGAAPRRGRADARFPPAGLRRRATGGCPALLQPETPARSLRRRPRISLARDPPARGARTGRGLGRRRKAVLVGHAGLGRDRQGPLDRGCQQPHVARGRCTTNEAWGRPRDRGQFPGPRGNGFYSQALYYRLLNCGLRIPPSAGSASGVLANPVGYNRAYVHLDGPFSYDGLVEGPRSRAGRS